MDEGDENNNAASAPDAVRLVCFDLGGVLVRIARGWADACQRAGIDLGPASAELAAHGQGTWERHQALLLRYETGEVDEAGYMREMPACFPGVPGQHVQRVFDAWLVGLYPGAGELIDELKSRGLRTACLSNTNERHWRSLIRLNGDYEPLTRLDHLFASHEIRVMKPDERAYRHVEQVTGLSGERILFFDDRFENVAAARAVGWRAEQTDPAAGADVVAQVRGFLARHGVL